MREGWQLSQGAHRVATTGVRGRAWSGRPGAPRLPPKLCSMHQMYGAPKKPSVRAHCGCTSAYRSSITSAPVGTPEIRPCGASRACAQLSSLLPDPN